MMSDDHDDDSDKILWKAFTKNIKSYQNRNQKILPTSKPTAPYKKTDQQCSFTSSFLDTPSKDLSFKKQTKKPVLHVEPSYFKKRKYTAVLDLHSHTIQSAERALNIFFYKQSTLKAKYVLIITGKGHMGEGVLRQMTQKWFLDHDEFIVGFSQALLKDGGSGAFYVHVRTK